MFRKDKASVTRKSCFRHCSMYKAHEFVPFFTDRKKPQRYFFTVSLEVQCCSPGAPMLINFRVTLYRTRTFYDLWPRNVESREQVAQVSMLRIARVQRARPFNCMIEPMQLAHNRNGRGRILGAQGAEKPNTRSAA